MLKNQKLKIVVVSAFYSEGMGYAENCLPRALASLGHEVHLITSTLNVYGNSSEYDRTYGAFLGPAVTSPGTTTVDSYQVHRLDTTLVSGYVQIRGLTRKVREISPDIVHSLEIASLQTFALAMRRPFARFKLFCESHQHMSVVRPFLKEPKGALSKKAFYWLTRTLPTLLASRAVEQCYAIAPDCLEVATRFYGVPIAKVKLLSLGADTDLFKPAESGEDLLARLELRKSLGYTESDIVCVYSGRFSQDKNPALLARAIDALSGVDSRFNGLFIGEGVQKEEIAQCRNTKILPFMKHTALADHYRAADIAVWPTQESMSMLDAASCGLPLVVSNTVGEVDRVIGNGMMYEENNVGSMVATLQSLGEPQLRRTLGIEGRRKMLDGFSWARFARAVEGDYLEALR